MNSMINIETTNKCPANCVVCPREKFNQKLNNMNMKLFKKIINNANDLGVSYIDTCGFGDPLSDPYFFDRCKYIKSINRNIIIYMSSTLFLLKDRNIYDILKYIDILKISFYGMDKEVFYRMHKLDFDRCLNNILKIVKEKKKINIADSPYLIGLFVETSINKHQTTKWIEYWENLLNEVFVWKPHNWAGLKDYREINHTNQKTCGRPINGPLYVHSDGMVSPCCWDINKKLIIGDMNTQRIEEIYKSTEYKNIKEKHENNNFDGLLCYNCEQTNFDPTVLLYNSNKDRKVGQLVPNFEDLTEKK